MHSMDISWQSLARYVATGDMKSTNNIRMFINGIIDIFWSDVVVGYVVVVHGIQSTEAVIDQQFKLLLRPWPVVIFSVVVDFCEACWHFFLDNNWYFILLDSFLAWSQEKTIDSVVQIYVLKTWYDSADVMVVQDLFEPNVFESVEGVHDDAPRNSVKFAKKDGIYWIMFVLY